MLKNIHPLLGPELLMILRAMGHGDEIAIVDANFPALANAQRLVRLDGVSATQVLEAVVSVLPLDNYSDFAVCTMQVVDEPDAIPEIVGDFQGIIINQGGTKEICTAIERFSFYDRVKQGFAVVATGEVRLYGNIILRKGVVNSG